MFLVSAYPDGNDCATSLHQETDILLADIASLLVKTIASPFSHLTT